VVPRPKQVTFNQTSRLGQINVRFTRVHILSEYSLTQNVLQEPTDTNTQRMTELCKKNQSTCMVQTTLKRSGMDHTVFNLQRTPCLPFLRKRSPDGASIECGGKHLIAAHYSFIDPEVSWPGWLTYSGRLTHISGHPSATVRAQDGERTLDRD